MLTAPTSTRTRVRREALLVPSLVGAVVAALGIVGGDARWLAPLGEAVLREGAVPDGIPYATAAEPDWPNVLVVAQVLLHVVVRVAGDAGLLLAQAVAVALGLWLLGRDAVASGARLRSVAVALALLAAGACTSLVVARLQLFSLALFPLVLLLLRQQARAPDRRIWLLPPLLALWGNLHGAVLLGLAVTGAYLVVDRSRRQPRSTAALVTACVAALFANPAGTGTVGYYLGVADNASAQLHVGLWARLSPTSPFDLTLLLVAAVLGVLFLRARPPAWELVAAAGLAVATLQAARSGVWLLVLLAGPAARSLAPTPVRWTRALAVGGVGALAGLTVVAALRLPSVEPSSDVLERAAALSDRCEVHAEGVLGEQLVARGGRVRITNPLDAFPADEQRRYVLWLETGAVENVPDSSGAVLTLPGSPADEALQGVAGFAVVAQDDVAVLRLRRTLCAA